MRRSYFILTFILNFFCHPEVYNLILLRFDLI